MKKINLLTLVIIALISISALTYSTYYVKHIVYQDKNKSFLVKTTTNKFYVDTNGYTHNYMPHAYAWYTDSSYTITLVQNTWYQAVNPIGRRSLPYSGENAEFVGFTIQNDTLICQKAGHYVAYFDFNATGVSTKIYQYRILQKNGTTATRAIKVYEGTGTTVVRHIPAYLDLAAGSKIWLEFRSTSISPGTVTVIGNAVLIFPIHLNI